MPDQDDLVAAAEAYVANRRTLYAFPRDGEEFRLLMEIAFMEGVTWRSEQANRHLRAEIVEKMGDLHDMEQEIEEARDA